MEMKFYDYLDANPVIAAVKDMDGVKKCCEREEIKIVFILFGDVCSICRIVEELKAHGKVAMVHMDLVSGLSGKEVAVDFIKKNDQGRRDPFHKACPHQAGQGAGSLYDPPGVRPGFHGL